MSRPTSAYYTNEGFARPDGSFELAQIERDQPGYFVHGVFPNLPLANAEADRLNQAAGVTPEQVMTIVASSMAVTHRWQYGRMTGAMTCERCGLLPLDSDDTASPCPGTKDRQH